MLGCLGGGSGLDEEDDKIFVLFYIFIFMGGVPVLENEWLLLLLDKNEHLIFQLSNFY